MVEIDKSKSFRYNLAAGCSKAELMSYYCIETEERWNKIIGSIKTQETKMLRKSKTMKGESNGTKQ